MPFRSIWERPKGAAAKVEMCVVEAGAGAAALQVHLVGSLGLFGDVGVGAVLPLMGTDRALGRQGSPVHTSPLRSRRSSTEMEQARRMKSRTRKRIAHRDACGGDRKNKLPAVPPFCRLPATTKTSRE